MAPLIIGIPKTSDITNFTERELELVSAFKLGALCISAGIGRIDEPKEFLDRIQITRTVTRMWELPEWFDLELIKKMKANDWSCNVSRIPTEEWESKMKDTLFDFVLNDYENALARETLKAD